MLVYARHEKTRCTHTVVRDAATPTPPNNPVKEEREKGGARAHVDSLGHHHADSDGRGVSGAEGLYATKAVEAGLCTTTDCSPAVAG